MNTEQEFIKNKINVWIIDDTISFCFILSEALNRSSTVQCTHYFHNCRTAFVELEEHIDPPTVILLDIKMPGLTGIEGIVPLKQRSPGSFIIMLTSYDSANEIKMALHRGADGYLLKTSTSADIIRSIESVVSGGTPIDPHITKKMMTAFIGVNQKEFSYKLSLREKEIVKLFANGLNTQEIAQVLFISFNTVNTHRRNIFAKLGVHSRHNLVAKAYKEGLID